jgi:hypothetical protein
MLNTTVVKLISEGDRYIYVIFNLVNGAIITNLFILFVLHMNIVRMLPSYLHIR